MDTSASAVPKERSSSGPLTAAIGVGVVVLAAIFAFDSAWYTHWYALFRTVHILFAVFWVGGGLMITVLALRAERSRNPEELAIIARQAAFAGEKLFAPAGLVGYGLTFVTGIGVLAPLAKKITVLVDKQGATAPETQAAIQRILLIARFDVALLLLVVADMVTKPFS